MTVTGMWIAVVVAFLRPRVTSGQTSGAAAEYREREILISMNLRVLEDFAMCPCPNPIDIFVYYLLLIAKLRVTRSLKTTLSSSFLSGKTK